VRGCFWDKDALNKIRRIERSGGIRIDCIRRKELIDCLVDDEVTQFPIAVNKRRRNKVVWSEGFVVLTIQAEEL
jgi:hypothetical protein